MGSLNPPLTFKTYQDVKNNLVYWTMILLMLTSVYVYFVFLETSTRDDIIEIVTKVGQNGLLSTLGGGVLILIYSGVSIFLIYGLQIHDKIYDNFFIKWRETYDLEFILPALTEPIKQHLPKNFLDFASKYKYKFMKPYYDFVGDGKKGIEDNTRVRFYERVTWYWITQLNELFVIILIMSTLLYFIISSNTGLTPNVIYIVILSLILLGAINRWFVSYFRKTVREATIDEIEEIHSNKENIAQIKKIYTELCKSHKL